MSRKSKRIVIVSIVVLVIAVIIILLLKECNNLTKGLQKKAVQIVLLNTKLLADSSKKNELINSIKNILVDDSNGALIELKTHNSIFHIDVEEPFGISSEDQYGNNLHARLIDLFSKVNISDDPHLDINKQIESLVQGIVNNSNNSTYAFFAGSFPVCYDSIDVANAISIIDTMLLDRKDNKDFKLAWCVFSNSGRPEIALLNHLDTTYGIINKQITTDIGDCDADNKQATNIEFYVFSGIDKDLTAKIIQQVKKHPKGKKDIRIMTKENKLEMSFNQSDSLDMSQFLENQLLNAEQTSEKRSRFMLDNMIKSHSSYLDTVSTMIYLIGNLPTTTKKPIDFSPLSGNSKKTFFLLLTSVFTNKKKGRKESGQEAFMNYFERKRINYIPIN